MNLSGFCRNCLSKWCRAEAEERGLEMSYDQARGQRPVGLPARPIAVVCDRDALIRQPLGGTGALEADARQR